MDRIYIKPGPSNKDGGDTGHWMIMVSQEGRDWCCNDKQDKTAAEIAAAGAAERRGLALDIVGTNNGPTPTKGQTAPLRTKDDYMKVARPRGAPVIGTRIRETILAAFNDQHDQVIESTVTDYLAEQFITETDDGATRVIHVKASFEEVPVTGR